MFVCCKPERSENETESSLETMGLNFGDSIEVCFEAEIKLLFKQSFSLAGLRGVGPAG